MRASGRPPGLLFLLVLSLLASAQAQSRCSPSGLALDCTMVAPDSQPSCYGRCDSATTGVAAPAYVRVAYGADAHCTAAAASLAAAVSSAADEIRLVGAKNPNSQILRQPLVSSTTAASSESSGIKQLCSATDQSHVTPSDPLKHSLQMDSTAGKPNSFWSFSGKNMLAQRGLTTVAVNAGFPPEVAEVAAIRAPRVRLR